MINAPHMSWVEVDLDAVRHNFLQLKSLVAPAGLLPVVKSEAYGHGLVPVAAAVVELGAWGLGIVSASEGIRLRQEGFTCPLVVLGPVIPAEMDEAVRHGLAPAVFDLDLARELSRRSQALGRRTRVHVKVDTGLGRLSVPAEQALDFVLEVSRLPGLELEGIYSHLADAEGLDQSYTLRQYNRFQSCLAQLEQAGLDIPVRHIAGSAAGMLLHEARLDLVRLGISLYGLWPAEETRLLMVSRGTDLLHLVNEPFRNGNSGERADPTRGMLKPALSYKTVVVQVKDVPRGSCVGYGCSYETTRDSRVAVLPIGYADGYDRHLGNSAEVLVRGRRARVVGRICMNLCMVDVTDIPEVESGDEVVLIGRQGDAVLPVEELAKKIGTINYEVVTRIPMHVPRVYLGKPAPVPAKVGTAHG